MAADLGSALFDRCMQLAALLLQLKCLGSLATKQYMYQVFYASSFSCALSFARTRSFFFAFLFAWVTVRKSYLFSSHVSILCCRGAFWQGGAAYVNDDSTMSFVNCTFHQNRANTGGAIRMAGRSDVR